MDRLQSGRAPLLDSHNGYGVGSILGVVESARLEKGQGVAVVRFAKAEDDPEADKIFRKVADGIIANVSVGYRVYRFEKVEDAADKIPVQRATDWEPYEISLVGMGADAGAGTRSADGVALNPCDFATRNEETTMEGNNGNTGTSGAPVAPPAAPNEDAIRAASEAATKAERERASEIRRAVRLAKLADSVAEDMVSRGLSVDAARAAVLDELAKRDEQTPTENHVRVDVGEDDRTKFLRAAEAGIFERSAVAKTIREAQKTAVAAEQLRSVDFEGASAFRRFTLVDLARECLERSGVKTRGMDRVRLVSEALTHRSGGMASASDFAILLESAMGKVLLAAYATQPDTWRRFCAVRSVPDFRTQNFYRNGSFGTLDAVNELGEFKQKAIPDGEKTTLSIGTKGNIIGLSRQAIINDDLGAFNDLAQRFGRAAALSIESDVYALIGLNSGLGPTQSDTQPLFHSNRDNVGTGAALSVESLDADAVLLAAQQDPSGNEYLDLRPAILLVPRGLEGSARVINDAQYDPDTANKLQRPNKVRGMFRDIVGTSRLTGTRRYTLADPDIAPVFAIAFLEGQQAPVLESKDGWRVDGTEWKVRIDYGVAAVDFRGAVTNSGAAQG